MSVTLGEGWEVPHEGEGFSEWTWFKIKAGTGLRLVMLSEKPVWYAGHFHKGRMSPCEGADCPLCAGGIGRQVRFVFGAASVESRNRGLIEVGESVGIQVRDCAARHGGLRGMVLCFTKATWAKQSRTEVEFVEGDECTWADTLECPDCGRALEATWQKAGFRSPGKQGDGTAAPIDVVPRASRTRPPSWTPNKSS